MKQQSLPGMLFTFVFAALGFLSNCIVMISRSGLMMILLAFIYITPLLIDSLHDLSIINAENKTQFTIDRIAVIVGVIVFCGIMAVFVLETKGIHFSFDIVLNYALALLPSIFVIRKFYAVRIKWRRNTDIANGYFSNKMKGIGE